MGMELEWVKLALAIVSGLSATIPLVIKLVEYVQKATKEKNWTKMLGLLLEFMEEAERKFEDGADRKEWVLAMVRASATAINYDIDIKVVSDMIDSLCDMSKVVNVAETPTESV